MRVPVIGFWPAIVVLLCCTSLNGAYAAEVFKWVDPQGGVHFSDTPPAENEAEKMKLREINSYRGLSVEDLDQQPDASNEVVMYGATWCGICKSARRFFKKNGIAYVEYDVERDRKGVADFKALKGRGVPIILVKGKRMNGFSEARFLALYRR